MAINKNFIIRQIRETYHELGEYNFKIILDPNKFKNSYGSEIEFIDADKNKMKFTVNRWGRKINCSFIIDESVPDGVSTVYIKLNNKNNNIINEVVQFWVIK